MKITKDTVVTLRFKATDDVMAYAQYSRGYRSSAFNGGAVAFPGDMLTSWRCPAACRLLLLFIPARRPGANIPDGQGAHPW